jgi:hypothetical protein
MGLVLIFYMIAGFFAGIAVAITSMVLYRLGSKTKIRDWGKVFYVSSFLGFLSVASIAIFTWPSRGPSGNDWDALAHSLFSIGASPGIGLLIGVIALLVKPKPTR